MWTFLVWTLFFSLMGPLRGVVKESSPGLIAVISKAAAHKYVTTMLLQNSLIQSHLLLIQFPEAPHKGHLEHWIKQLHVVRVFVPYIQLEQREVCTVIVRTRLHLSAKFFFGKHFERIDVFIDVNFKTDLSFTNFVLGSVDISLGAYRSEFKVARVASSSRLQVAKVKPLVKTVLAASLPRLFSGAAELLSVITELFAHRKCPKCPVRSPLKVAITLIGTKKIFLQPNLITLHLSVQISIFALSLSGAPNGLFVLRANLAQGLHATVHDNKLKVSSLINSVELILVSSEFGPIEISGLVKWIKLLLKETYLPHINDCLNVGIPLPSLLHVRMTYPAIELIQGMILLCV